MTKQNSSKVYLVGAGPGDPRLLTLRAKRLLERADVVLYDYLAHPNCLNYCKKGTELISVGKRKGAHSATQIEINQLLVTYAKQNKIIVRLKGGDPQVFGRIGEEIEELEKHQIPFEIVPGVSSASAVPAYAGIPLTHRNLARSVAFVTGTLKTGDGIDDIHIPHAETLIFLMSVTHLEWIVERLTTPQPSKSPRFDIATPAALIYKGTTSSQQKVVGTLTNIVALRDEHQVSHPSILVVGKVAELSHTLDWYSKLPLFGKRIINLRPLNQGQSLTEKLSDLGAEVVEHPMIHIKPIMNEQKIISKAFLAPFTKIIFTSANGVEQFMMALLNNGCDGRDLANKTILCVGPKTASALKRFGIIADNTAYNYSQEGLLDILPSNSKQDAILLPTAKKARPFLEEELKKRGATVHKLALYDTVATTTSKPITVFDNDIVVFTSSSIAEFFFESTLYKNQRITAICIGTETEKTVRRYIKINIFEAKSQSEDALIQCITEL